MRASIEGQAVAIEAGAATDDPNDVVTHAIAGAIADELTAAGAKPVVVGSEGSTMSSDRAREANEMGASMCISLHLASGLPEASGPTCSYFGSASTHSPAGMLLAQLILEELEAELGVRGRLQRLTGAMLRETRMPAVQVEPVFITNAVEAALLVDPEFGGRIGRAVAAGVRRFFQG